MPSGGHNRISAAEHKRRGTFQPSRHDPARQNLAPAREFKTPAMPARLQALVLEDWLCLPAITEPYEAAPQGEAPWSAVRERVPASDGSDSKENRIFAFRQYVDAKREWLKDRGQNAIDTFTEQAAGERAIWSGRDPSEPEPVVPVSHSRNNYKRI